MNENYCGTKIEDPPQLIGRAGKAWRLTIPPVGQRSRPDFDATIAGYVVQVPGVHPLWDHWMASVIHLRDIPGGSKPATIRDEGATHELMIVSLDPGKPLPSLIVGADWKLPFLLPLDVTQQFTVGDDNVAEMVLKHAVDLIVEGIASPDQDARRWWASAVPTIAVLKQRDAAAADAWAADVTKDRP